MDWIPNSKATIPQGNIDLLRLRLLGCRVMGTFPETPEWEHTLILDPAEPRNVTGRPSDPVSLAADRVNRRFIQEFPKDTDVDVFPDEIADQVGMGPGSVMVNARGYATFRKYLLDEMRLEHRAQELKSGLMGGYLNKEIWVSRFFSPFDLIVLPAPVDAGRFAFDVELGQTHGRDGLRVRWTMEGPNGVRAFRIREPHHGWTHSRQSQRDWTVAQGGNRE